MIKDIQEAIDQLKDLNKFFKMIDVKIAKLEDTIKAQHETIHHLEKGVNRRDEIIRELQDQLEATRRIR